MIRNSLLVAALIGISLSMSACGFTTVDPGERAVVVEMGKVKELRGNGFTTFNPFTQQLHEYSVKQETKQGSTSPLTSDQQPIHINYRVMYRIPEAKILKLFETVKGDPFEVLVQPQLQEAFRQVVAKYKAEQVTGGVETIKNEVLAAVRKNVGSDVEIIDTPITQVELPGPLQASVLAKQQMEMEAKKKQFELLREQKEAEIRKVQAEAEATTIRLKSQMLKASPEYIKNKLADAEVIKAQKWNGQLPQTVVGQSSNMLFNLK